MAGRKPAAHPVVHANDKRVQFQPGDLLHHRQGNWKQLAASAIESILQIEFQYEESKLPR